MNPQRPSRSLQDLAHRPLRNRDHLRYRFPRKVRLLNENPYGLYVVVDRFSPEEVSLSGVVDFLHAHVSAPRRQCGNDYPLRKGTRRCLALLAGFPEGLP